ncbi:MAG TPA: cyclic nucleotide-binding domain-containing protein [Ghiorsea sp.]|nr:cyclic nucleotide-binding domain-containing protein [Ghiorsea sp.]HIP07728.1 cyclic nucleotide-binding domain-containing protein [Mariprofundaceae bacterium]
MDSDVIVRSEDFQGSAFPDLAVLYPEDLEVMFEAAEVQTFAANEPVITEGQEGKYLFLVKSGLLRVVKHHAGSTYEVATIAPGDVFGEASILYKSKAGAEVRAMDDCVLYAIPKQVVQDVLQSNERFMRATTQLAEKRSAASALAVNPIFSTLPMAVREVVLFNAKFFSLQPGEVLIAEGDVEDNHMFIILAGELKVRIVHPNEKGKNIELATLSSGDEAGEITVVTNLPHMATVAATGQVRVLAIRNSCIVAWANRYSDFAYALYGLVYRKLTQTQEVLKNILSPREAKILTLYTMPSLEEFKKQHHL